MEQHNSVELINIEENKKRTSNQTRPKLGSRNQFRALFYKNASLQKKQKCTNFCQLCIPMLLIVLVGVMNILVQSLNEEPDSTDEIRQGDVRSIGPPGGYNYFIYIDKSNSPSLGELTINGNKSGILGGIWQSEIFGPTGDPLVPPKFGPFFVQFPDDLKKMDDTLLEIQKNLRNLDLYNNQASVRDDNPMNLTHVNPTGGYIFNSIDPSSFKIDVTLMYETSEFRTRWYPPKSAVNMLLYTILNTFAKYVFNNEFFELRGYFQEFPSIQLKRDLEISSILAAFLFPFAFSFLFPVYVYGIVHEKQEKLREIMKMNGLKMKMYWIINYLYNLVLYSTVTLVVIIIGIIFGLPFFTKTSGLLTILLFLGWGLNQISFGFMLTTFFSKARTATIICYLLVIFGILISNVVNAAAYSDSEANSGYLIWPAFAFYRAIYLIGTNCADNLCPQTKDMGTGSEYSTILIILYLEAIVFTILTGYLDEVLPKEFGVRRSPWFPITELIKKFDKKKHHYERIDKVTISEFEDEDVAQERKLVESLTAEDVDKYPVIVQRLHKRYDDKVAIEDLCLALPKNETFALLGPNGAGKTTTISILTGLFMPTSGSAYVDGFDIREEMDLIHQVIGICPQFDILWDTLTCFETILFYCRLKGIPIKNEKEVAMHSLQQVQLDNAADLQVNELSGGMKRRLSIAISLVGNPSVIFLDEPTTGLDPETRRQLWNVLLEVKKNKCVILTTHSMEEADILCTRVGIMSLGALRCLGTNIHLKNKFGEGYTLKVNFSPDDEQTVIQFIQSILPRAKLEEGFPGNYTYRIPSEGFLMSELLNNLNANQETSKIKDYGISQTSLEDVFLNIVKKDETEETQPSNSTSK